MQIRMKEIGERGREKYFDIFKLNKETSLLFSTLSIQVLKLSKRFS